MVLTDDLPSDSVLRRHTLTERGRLLGLPPSDAVLRRHHEQLMASEAASAPLHRGAPTPVARPATSARAVPMRPMPTSAPPAAAAGGGGLLGWLKRLLGG